MTHRDHHRLGRQSLTERTPQQPWTAGYGDDDDRSSRNHDSRDPENFELNTFDDGYVRDLPTSVDALRARVEAVLQIAGLDASAIEVLLVNGRVVLRGRVKDAQSKLLVEQLVGPLAGVRQIMNELEVHRIDEVAPPH